MAQANWLILPMVAIIPIILGMIWYNPKVMGTKLAQINDQPISSISSNFTIGRIALVYLLSVFFAYVLMLNSVHQVAIFQLFFMDSEVAKAGSEYQAFIDNFMENYGHRHRSFGHGLLHGAEAAFFYGLGTLGLTTLLTGGSLKKIWIHLGFIVICGSLMAGFICAFF